MAGNRSSSSRVGGASISAAAAAAAAGSAEARFPPPERQSKWGGCFGGLSCFGSQKGGKRIVPASRIPEGNASASRGNGPQAVENSNQNATLIPSLFAPPSSPASFTNSALPSTAQSPNCFLSMSANSPEGPSSTMFVTGPYAHETQLVTPPVFSTYTTEPSTASLTPPPELAHLTTPSSPDVPYAKFLSSSLDVKTSGKTNCMPFMSSRYAASGDYQATYLYPGSPSSSLISPASGTPRTGLSSPYPEREGSTYWGSSLSAHDSPYSRSGSSNLFGLDSASSRNPMLSLDSSYFCPATTAHFYLDQAAQSFPSYAPCGGRSSVSREADIYTNGGNRHSKACKQDVEEIEAYRASFGFSADEITSTQNYVEISDVADESFTISPFPNSNPCVERCSAICPASKLGKQEGRMETVRASVLEPENPMLVKTGVVDHEASDTVNACTGRKPQSKSGSTSLAVDDHAGIDGLGGRLCRISSARASSRIRSGQSCSDAEVDYRRARSLKDAKSMLVWHNSMP